MGSKITLKPFFGHKNTKTFIFKYLLVCLTEQRKSKWFGIIFGWTIPLLF